MNRQSWIALATCAAFIGFFAASCSSGGGSSTTGHTTGVGGAGSGDGSAGAEGDAGGSGGSQQPQDASHETATGCWVVHLDLGGDCNSCAYSACCSQMVACDGDPTCVQLAACVANCQAVDGGSQHDPACVQSCAQPAQSSGVPAAYNPLITCLSGAACAPVCHF